MEINKIEKKYRKINKTKSCLRRSIKLIFFKKREDSPHYGFTGVFYQNQLYRNAFRKLKENANQFLVWDEREREGLTKGITPLWEGVDTCSLSFFFWKVEILFIIIIIIFYFWLRWVFVAAHRLSLVAESGVYSSHCSSFSFWGARALGVRASVVVARGL